MQIKHVFFDLDHTLWDFDANSKKAYTKCFEKHGITTDFNNFITHYEPINHNYWKLYREEQITKEALKYGRLKDAFKAVNYSVSDKLISLVAEDYLSFLPHFNQLFDGTIEVLDYLKKKYELHIITNGFEEIQTHKMQQSGLDKYFKLFITSEQVGVKKPNPKIFLYALSEAKALPEESIMIGDNLEADVQGAINVGMQALYFNPTGTHRNNKNEIRTLLEIFDYL